VCPGAGPEAGAGSLLTFAFVVLLVASEAALTLPDETAGDLAVASFHAHHRGAVVVLQILFVVLVGTLGVLSARGRLEARSATAGARASA
jgi:hypothetical protein